MKQILCSTLLLAVALTVVSCSGCHSHFSREFNVFDEGPRVTQIRSLKGFEEIQVLGSPTVYYEQGDTFGVRIEGPENLVNDIVTEVSGKALVIRNKGKIGMLNISINDWDDLAVHVTSPDLVSVMLSGSGDFMAHKQIDTDNMQITLRGSGDIDIENLICDHCVTELVGSGDVSIASLDAMTSEVTLVGSGDMSLKQKNVRQTDISLRGSGDISVEFKEGCHEVNARLLGSGDVSLKGQVKKFSQQKTGSGDIDTDGLSVR